jgi:hypothetical protein
MRRRGRLAIAAMAVAGAIAVVIAGAPLPSRAQDDDAPPAEAGPSAKLSATSTVEVKRYADGTLVPRTRNVSFRFFAGLLFRQQIDIEEIPPWKGEGWAQADVQITAFELSPGGKRKERFRISEWGMEATPYGNFYAITQYGCCETMAGQALYSLRTGKYLMHTAGEDVPGSIVRVKADDSRAKGGAGRWVGVNVGNAAYNEAAYEKKSRKAQALVTYASDDKAIMRVLLQLGDPNDLLDPKIEVRHGKAAKAGAGGSGASVHIQLLDDVAVDIPLGDDTLDVARASLPDGATAKVAPLD